MKNEKHLKKLYKLILFSIVFLATFILFQETNKVSGYFSDFASAEVTMTIKTNNSTSNQNSLSKPRNNVASLLSNSKDNLEVNNITINNFFEQSKIAEKHQELENKSDETINTEPITSSSEDTNINSDDENTEIKTETPEDTNTSIAVITSEEQKKSEEQKSENSTDSQNPTDNATNSEDIATAKKELDDLIKSLSDEEKTAFKKVLEYIFKEKNIEITKTTIDDLFTNNEKSIQDILLEKYNIDLTDYLDLIENIIYHKPIKDGKTENFFSMLSSNSLNINQANDNKFILVFEEIKAKLLKK